MSTWFRRYGYAAVAPNLAIGAYLLDDEDIGTIERLGVRRVLNLVHDVEYPPGARKSVEYLLAQAEIEEQRFRIPDFGGLPPAAVDFVIAIINRWLDEGQTTYVHCRAGWQRSAAIAAALLAVRDGLDIDEAVQVVRSRKPDADPLPHQREDLRRWWSARRPLGHGATS